MDCIRLGHPIHSVVNFLKLLFAYHVFEIQNFKRAKYPIITAVCKILHKDIIVYGEQLEPRNKLIHMLKITKYEPNEHMLENFRPRK